jgi:hypothetical protein
MAACVRRACRAWGECLCAGGSSPCPGKGWEGREDGGGAAVELGSDEARVGWVRMGTAELQGDRGARRAAEATRDLVEGPGGHVDIVNGHEHVLLLGK